ncbi:MAG: hypothetical protein WCL27_00140 [Betaproteobacteria bacterium]
MGEESMNGDKWSLSRRLYLTGVVILVLGLLSAATIYFTVAVASEDVLGYEIIDGKAYPLMVSDSKMYRHDLERFGGKAAIMADDLNRWFSGLWQGKQLAWTVAILTIMLALGFFRAGWWQASHHPPGKAPDGQ